MQLILYLTSYSPYIFMVLFLLASLGMIFIKLLSDFWNDFIDVSFVISWLYEPLIISMFALFFVAQIFTSILYWSDLKKTAISAESIKKWQKILVWPPTLALMYFYDFKYAEKEKMYPFESIFRTTRDRVVELVDLDLPIEIRQIKEQQNNSGHKDMSFYAFFISLGTIATTLLLSMLLK